MRLRFQADADLNYKIVAGIRRREPTIDVRTAGDGGVVGVDDLRVLEQAAAAGAILVSHDRRTMPAHFARFIANQHSPGLIIVSQSLDIGAAIDDLLLIWATTEAEDWVNRIGFVPL